MRNLGWASVLFGGIVRHLLRPDASDVPPRDVDIVIDGGSSRRLALELAPYCPTRNRWGGFRFSLDGISFDVWLLRETWGFGALPGVPRVAANLPRTTFLNIEAVAVAVEKDRRGKRQVHSHGFCEALESRTLDVNLETNPYPAACVVRALVTAARERMDIDPTLWTYLRRHGRALSTEEIEAIQLTHYGRLYLDARVVRDCIDGASLLGRVGVSSPVIEGAQCR